MDTQFTTPEEVVVESHGHYQVQGDPAILVFSDAEPVEFVEELEG